MSDTFELTGRVTNEAGQPDLSGNLFPVAEETDVARCEVEGEIPEGLRGSFVRNGPNPMFEPIARYHMFDGDGMLHGFTFGDDGVSYRNRWIRSRGLRRELEHGPGHLPRPGQRDGLPRPLAHRRCGPGEEPGQHPHHPPRRPLPGPVGGRRSDRGDTPSSTPSASTTSTAA